MGLVQMIFLVGFGLLAGVNCHFWGFVFSIFSHKFIEFFLFIYGFEFHRPTWYTVILVYHLWESKGPQMPLLPMK